MGQIFNLRKQTDLLLINYECRWVCTSRQIYDRSDDPLVCNLTRFTPIETLFIQHSLIVLFNCRHLLFHLIHGNIFIRISRDRQLRYKTWLSSLTWRTLMVTFMGSEVPTKAYSSRFMGVFDRQVKLGRFTTSALLIYCNCII